PGPTHIYIDLPPSSYTIIAKNAEFQTVARRALEQAASGHDRFNREVSNIEFRMMLSEVSENWRQTVRNMIVNYKGSNQGLVSEILAARNARPVHQYNELRYASKAEIKIAMELEARKVLF